MNDILTEGGGFGMKMTWLCTKLGIHIYIWMTWCVTLMEGGGFGMKMAIYIWVMLLVPKYPFQYHASNLAPMASCQPKKNKISFSIPCLQSCTNGILLAQKT